MSDLQRLDFLTEEASPQAPLVWPARVGLDPGVGEDDVDILVDALTDVSEEALRRFRALPRRDLGLRLRLAESPVCAAPEGRALARLTELIDGADEVLVQTRAAVVRLACSGALGLDADLRLVPRSFELPPPGHRVLVCAAPGRGARAMDEGALLATCPRTFAESIGQAGGWSSTLPCAGSILASSRPWRAVGAR